MPNKILRICVIDLFYVKLSKLAKLSNYKKKIIGIKMKHYALKRNFARTWASITEISKDQYEIFYVYCKFLYMLYKLNIYLENFILV